MTVYKKMVVMFAFFQAEGRAPSANDCMKSKTRTEANSNAGSLRTRAGI